MKIKPMFIILFVVMALSACTPTPDVEQVPTLPPEPSPIPTQTEISPAPLTLEEAAETVINALAEKDLAAVAEVVHPEQGVRFSPYTYVEESHQVFAADELAGLAGSVEIFLWGYFDGTGDPIQLTFDDYYERFIYSADFDSPEAMAVNEELGFGNTINNIADFYPGSSFVEYHFSGIVEEYSGMDWVSLRLVFVEEDGSWFLIGIVHDQWTI
jgi:hypothetical protein